jgi:hypothetical protein
LCVGSASVLFARAEAESKAGDPFVGRGERLLRKAVLKPPVSPPDRQLNLYLVAAAREPNCKFTCNLGGTSFLYGAFPDHARPPSMFLKTVFGSAIALHVTRKLGLPKLTIGGRISSKTTTLVPVPETAMNLYRRSVARKNNVWPPWQCSIMDPETKPEPVKGAPDGHLRLRVLGTNAGHHPRARRLVDHVDHFFSWNPANFLVSVLTGGRIVQWQSQSML